MEEEKPKRGKRSEEARILRAARNNAKRRSKRRMTIIRHNPWGSTHLGVSASGFCTPQETARLKDEREDADRVPARMED